ncbi:putative ribonuclease P [Helianthus annuus]|nr:putative ribonuclease P [Helianthus annuus]
MVGFKYRYMAMEVFIDPNKDISKDDPIILSQHNISKAIKDSILVNFGECGLASSLVSFQVKYVNPITKVCIIRASRDEHQKVWAATTMVRSVGNCPVVFNLLDLSGNIKACKSAALKCEEMKFEHLKIVSGALQTEDINKHMHNLERIKMLER